MIDLRLPAQDAIFAALEPLDGTIYDEKPAHVYQHVPDDTQPPIFVIADMTAEPIGGKDGGLDRIVFEVITMFRGPRRAALFEMQSAVRDALDGKPLPTQAGAVLSEPVFESSDDEILEDGITYLGTQRFSLFAQPTE